MGSIDKSYGCRWKEYILCRVCVGKFGMGCGVWTYKLWLNYLQGGIYLIAYLRHITLFPIRIHSPKLYTQEIEDLPPC